VSGQLAGAGQVSLAQDDASAAHCEPQADMSRLLHRFGDAVTCSKNWRR
jgi:hypothetical protein